MLTFNDCRYDTPLVADIHFQPQVAMIVAEAFEKIRINPGNFADGRKSFKVINYDDPKQFELEKQHIREVRDSAENPMKTEMGCCNHSADVSVLPLTPCRYRRSVVYHFTAISKNSRKSLAAYANDHTMGKDSPISIVPRQNADTFLSDKLFQSPMNVLFVVVPINRVQNTACSCNISSNPAAVHHWLFHRIRMMGCADVDFLSTGGEV